MEFSRKIIKENTMKLKINNSKILIRGQKIVKISRETWNCRNDSQNEILRQGNYKNINKNFIVCVGK